MNLKQSISRESRTNAPRERERERERHIDIAFCHFLGSSLQMGSPIVGQSGRRHSLCQNFPEKKSVDITFESQFWCDKL